MQAGMRRIVHRTLSDPSSTPHATVRREVSIEEEDTHKTILETTKEGEQNHISSQFKSHRQLSIEDSRPTHDKKCNVEGKETMSSGSVQFFSGKRPDLENIISNMSPRDSEVFFIGNPALGKTIENVCSKYDLKYFGDFTSGKTQSDSKVFRQYFVTTMKVILAITVVCGYLHLLVLAAQPTSSSYQRTSHAGTTRCSIYKHCFTQPRLECCLAKSK